MPHKRMVGLIIFTVLPDKGLVAILQKRGEFNHETMQPESFPGGCQLTVWGGVEENETPTQALLRETSEEIGNILWWRLRWQIEMKEKTFCRLSGSGRRKDVRTIYAMMLKPELLGRLQLGAASGGIVLLEEEEIGEIRKLNDFDRSLGVQDRSVIAMWPDARRALIKGFCWAKNQKPKS